MSDIHGPAVLVAAFAAALVAAAVPAAAQSPEAPRLASIDPARGADVGALRARAWRDDAVAQWTLATRLADAHRRGADDSSLVEAAYWAGRAWEANRPPVPAAMAAFVAAHCGAPAIARHWVCAEGE